MKQKSALLLMEQLVMILVFSLAAALCLQVFARADAISEETARRDRAVALAQNAAQLLKATGGDRDAAEALEADGCRVRVVPLTTEQPGLARAEIAVFHEETLLFSLNTGWQEALP